MLQNDWTCGCYDGILHAAGDTTIDLRGLGCWVVVVFYLIHIQHIQCISKALCIHFRQQPDTNDFRKSIDVETGACCSHLCMHILFVESLSKWNYEETIYKMLYTLKIYWDTLIYQLTLV